MPEWLVLFLLVLALVVPVPGAIALRLLFSRLSERVVLSGMLAMFALAMLSTLVLGFAEVRTLRIGGLSILLTGRRFSDDLVAPLDLPPEGELAPLLPPTLTPRPTATPTLTASSSPTLMPTASATPTVSPMPTEEKPSATVAADEPRRYTVQPGDSLRAIAERFAVTVEAILQANDLTSQQGDALRPGQELIIPVP